MQLVHVELDQHARGLAAWEVWTVRDHAPFTSARDAHDAPGAAAAPQREQTRGHRAGATRSFSRAQILHFTGKFLYSSIYKVGEVNNDKKNFSLLMDRSQ